MFDICGSSNIQVIVMKANKQHFCSKMSSKLSTFLPIMLVLVLLSFFFSISKSFPFLLAIPIALLSTLFLVTLKKKKGSKNESVVQEKLQKEELQHSFVVSETENHEEKAEAQMDYSFQLDCESKNFLVMNKTFEFNVHENMQQDDLISDSSLPSDSETSNVSIMDETFEIDHNGYQNLSSHDSLVSDTDGEDDDYDYDDEGFNRRIIVDTNYNLDGKDGSLLSYSHSVNLILDDDDYDEDEEEEDSLIEIHLPRNFSNLVEEPKQKMEPKLPNFLSESIFKQQSLMQLLEVINDMNEDENLIEIDISM